MSENTVGDNTGLSPDNLSPEDAGKADLIRTAVTTYIDQVKPLGIVTAVIFGTKPGEPARVFNVFKEDFLRDTPDHKELRHFGTQLEKALRDIIPTYVSAVNPSRLGDFLEDCSRQGIETSRMAVEH